MRVSHHRDERQLDLFVAYLTDLPLRDQRDTMERPFFALTKTRRTTPIEYRVGEVFVKVSAPADIGLATIWDADVLIWAVSQINEAKERGLATSPRLKFMPYDLLRAIQRDTGGRQYELLRAAMRRLTASVVETNIRAPAKRKAAMFHWIERWTEETDDVGNSKGMTIELPRWLYDAIDAQHVLAVHRDYFKLTGGLERWLYRVVRKHAGNQQAGWTWTLQQLHAKSGSTQRQSDFGRDLRQLVMSNKLPEYWLTRYRGERGDECFHAVRRTHLVQDHPGRDGSLLQARGARRTRPARLTSPI